MITEKYGLQTFEDTDEADLPKYSKETNKAIIEALDNNKGESFRYEDFTQEQLEQLRADVNNLQHTYTGTNIVAQTAERKRNTK